MNKTPYSILLAFLLLLSPPIDAKAIRGVVVGVNDGDTITVLKNGISYKIRLYGIDCPELHQAFGMEAKQFTSNLAFEKKVKIKVQATDRYGRYVGSVTLPDGHILSQELLKNGLAWHYRRYSTNPLLQTLEDRAKEAKLGLWAQPSPIPPWEFRHNSNKN